MINYPSPKFNTISYAGNGEDVVLMRAFDGKRGGFFVDVGAGEPDIGSLTKNLVDRLDWRGINIEPLPDAFERLSAARPHDTNLQMAIDTEPGRAVFHRILPAQGLVGGPGLSTLAPEIVDMHRATGWGVEDFEVDVITLEAVLRQYAKPRFDLLKVDVEGREAAVLKSAGLAHWKPRVIVAEATLPDTVIPSHADWEPYLVESGYELALFDGLNRFYFHKSEPDLGRRLAIPANVTDRWIPAGWAQLLGHEV